MYAEPTMLQKITTAIKKHWVFSSLLAITIIVLGVTLFIFLQQSTKNEYIITKTNYEPDQTLIKLDGTHFYSFNGLAFTQVNTSTGQATMLLGGKRYPNVGTIIWGSNKGVLLNFTSSLYSTEVETALSQLGEPLDAAQDYTWFLDFSTKKLTLVNKKPILAELAVYSEKDNGFYYMPSATDQPGTVTPLHFYDITNNKDEIIASDLQVTDTYNLQPCDLGVCFTARDLSDTSHKRLYSVKKGEDKKIVFQVVGRIFASNKPNLYLVIGQTGGQTKAESHTDNVAGHTEEADYSNEPASIYDTNSKKSYKLGPTFGATAPSIHFIDDTNFYIINGNAEDSSIYYTGSLSDSSASTSQKSFKDKDSSQYVDPVINILGHGEGSLTFSSTLGNKYVFFGDPSLISASLTPLKRDDVEIAVKACVGQTSGQIEYASATKTFQAAFTADDTFISKTESFYQCLLSKNPAGYLGYTFKTAGIDPINGRISIN